MSDERATSAMVVVAHADDAELDAGGTIARWVAEGARVVYVVATDGSKGTSDSEMAPEELIRIRRQEQLDAAREIGVADVEFLGYSDGYLEPTLELRGRIARLIRKHRPERLVTQTFRRFFTTATYLNHPDHFAVGEATLSAVYPGASCPRLYPELSAEGLEPHQVREVYVSGTDAPDCWVDVTGTIQRKVEALLRFPSQILDVIAANPGNPWVYEAGPDEVVSRWVRERAATAARGHGVRYAEAFKLYRFDAPSHR